MFTADRARMRGSFVLAWRKHRQATPMTPLEVQIAEVVWMHPQYHVLLEDPHAVHEDFADAGETNPFLHMAMHLGLREQVSTDRPAGVRKAMAALVRRCGERHAAEHEAMQCLAEALWQAQGRQQAPDDQAYLSALNDRARSLRPR